MRVDPRVIRLMMAGLLAIPGMTVAAQFDCQTSNGHPASLRLEIPEQPAGSSVYLGKQAFAFSTHEIKGSVILFSEMGPGADDERFVTYRMLRFDRETGQLNYIQHIPTFKHTQAICTPPDKPGA